MICLKHITEKQIEVFRELRNGNWINRSELEISANKRILTRLAKRGLICMQKDIMDARCKRIRLTNKGIKLSMMLEEMGDL